LNSNTTDANTTRVIPDLEACGGTESTTTISLESSNLEKELAKLLDNQF
jgi:hypothetical protein